MKKLLCCLLYMLLASFLLPAGVARADVIFDSGSVFFTEMGDQHGRLFRDGVPSTWSTPKTFPGIVDVSNLYAYELFTINTGIYSFIQISFDTTTTVFFDAAYLNSYTPVNNPPYFGLNVNYLGDAGSSGNVPHIFQIQVPASSTLLIVVNEVRLGEGEGNAFDLKVEGFTSAAVPEPATMLLLGSGLIGFAGYGRRKFFRK